MQPGAAAVKTLVIIPALNESGNILKVVSGIKSAMLDVDILVVDDGSFDNTAQLAEDTAASVIRLPFNLGIGGAVQTGFKYAHLNGYDAVVQFDADGQHDASFIKDILDPVLKENVDLCVGSRFLAKDAYYKSSFLRRVGIKFFSCLISLLTGQKTTDPTSGFRATGKKLIALFSCCYPIDFPEPEGIVIARCYNAKIKEVPVRMHPRQSGVSSIRFLKSGYYMFKVTLAVILCLLKKRSYKVCK
ncbi:MAG: glycosyltransferase family 2 protein [Candidatus Omnitrophica bacterium]|jgi:hypothetical protein|nr:glycosyltransferase family 2 protein [Candidatus Omnitrophota bacterium]